ncbi:MAG: transcription-repair coupling factor [Roseiflexaceae bacterium]|nr:transcription-repair coupling factor [Roseiflexaceae bacterium]
MSDLVHIRHLIARHPAVAALIATLQPAVSTRLHVAPAIGAARTPLVAVLTAALDRPVLYLVATTEAALRAFDDLRQWLTPEQVLLFPAADALPYEHMSPGPDVIAGRLRVLQRLSMLQHADAGVRAPLVIVAPIKALMQPTLAPADLADSTVRLERGDTTDLDDLIARLIAIGYRMAPTVEEPGELNRRGGIVDIFPPGDELPLRIEFFGDEVDSLRRFDPISQRSDTREREVLVGPPHEIPLWRRDEALSRLRAVDITKMRREALDEWEAALDRLSHGERFEGRAFYAPFFQAEADLASGQLPSLFDHLPVGTPVVCSEMNILARHLDDLDIQSEQRRATQVEVGELPAVFPRPYLRWNELLAQATRLTLVNLTNNELLPSQEAVPIPFVAQHLPATLFVPADLYGGQLRLVVDDIAARLRAGEQVVVVTPQAARIQEMIGEVEAKRGEAEHGPIAAAARYTLPDSLYMVHGTLEEGFRSTDLNMTLYSDAEIFGWRQRRAVAERRRRRDRNAEERAAFLRGLKPGDFVVHIEHGIAQYEGLVRRTVGTIDRDYLNLRYADGDRLYVPIDQIDRVSRYIGAGDADPHLTRLGTQDWERAKRKARQAVQELADELIRLYAERQLSQGFAFSPDTEWQRDLEASFPYVETPDQLSALVDVKHDMEITQPMDRLICGDVGFGKTEVALRAAFKAVQDGKQVAILVPTTVLAQQHFDTFSRRMAAFPLKVEMISRFRSAKEQTEIMHKLRRGEVDIIVGTHRLLSKDITFKDLGLLVIDEEQRFGVRHKERIKQIRANVDVLTLTATPIPRTLHMALAGIRDLSVIDTPPEDRVPIKTYVLPYDDNLIREAILRELDRGGQIYFVHNRVQSIYYVAEKLRLLVPEAEIGVGHGQLEEHQLERVMLDFFTGKDDVLVCTTIIESGLDVPNANTLIIDDATNYGLAQLYQLRGRVGRSAQRAYAYLLFRQDKPMTPEAQERLQAIQEATELGAGFRIAMKDLEIRGAGNLLGSEQSGHIAAVGFDLYSRLLEQSVRQLKEQLIAANYQDPTTGIGSQKSVDAATNGTQTDAASPSPTPHIPESGRKRPVLKVDEKVLITPLVTLDLPLDAYLPPEYVADDRVRLSVYQSLVEAQTPTAVRGLRQDLRERFGDLPEAAEALLQWLLIKALALAAGVTSIVTTDEEFIVRLPEGGPLDRERLRRRFGRDPHIKVGPQFVRLDRRSLGGRGSTEWLAALTGVLETLAKST